MSKLITILAVIPDHLDGTSFYRGVGPLANLKKRHGLNISIVYPSEVNWSVCAPCDVLFLQRPFLDQHVNILKIAKRRNLPIWVDYDDDLFSVGTDNPTHYIYSKPSIQRNIAELLTNADVVTVSTQAIKAKYDQFNKNVHVVNNGIDVSVLKYRVSNEKMIERNPLVMWRGSQTHTKDVLSVANEILETHDENPDLIFEFLGDRQFLLTEQMKSNQLIFTPWSDCDSFMEHIYQRRPKAFIVPLVFSNFNRAKSNIAYLESAFAGAVSIVPNLPEFVQPGALVYSSQAEFKDHLKTVVNLNDSDHLYYAKLAWKNVTENFTLDTINLKRKTLLESML